MISVYLVENAPYVVWTDLRGDVLGLGRRLGEWVWVGRAL